MMVLGTECPWGVLVRGALVDRLKEILIFGTWMEENIFFVLFLLASLVSLSNQKEKQPKLMLCVRKLQLIKLYRAGNGIPQNKELILLFIPAVGLSMRAYLNRN